MPKYRNKTIFKLAGKNSEGEWTVMHPSGLLCGGTWETKNAAQTWCDNKNRQKGYWNTESTE